MRKAKCCDPQQQLFCHYQKAGGDPALFRRWQEDPVAQEFWRCYQDVPLHYWSPKNACEHSDWNYSPYRKRLREQWRRCCQELGVVNDVFGFWASIRNILLFLRKLRRLPAYLRRVRSLSRETELD